MLLIPKQTGAFAQLLMEIDILGARSFPPFVLIIPEAVATPSLCLPSQMAEKFILTPGTGSMWECGDVGVGNHMRNFYDTLMEALEQKMNKPIFLLWFGT